MATQQHIRAFPEGKDRERFANWITGFCDGEAHFSLHVDMSSKTRTLFDILVADFSLLSGGDDHEILYLIQSYFGVGIVKPYDYSGRIVSNKNPITKYSVQGSSDLANVIIPHFDKFPLESKKRNDYEIWNKGIYMMYEVSKRRRVGRKDGLGIHYTWTQEERQRFHDLCLATHDIRKYRESPIDAPKIDIPRPASTFKQRDFWSDDRN